MRNSKLNSVLNIFILIFILAAGMLAEAASAGNYTADVNEVRDGYYINKKEPVACKHAPDDSAYIYVQLKGLGNTKERLKENVRLVKNGNRAFQYTIRTATEKVAGIGNEKVSGNVLIARIEDHDFELAYPYICEDDGHAGYAYIKCYFSYCENTEKWYFLGSSHYWLGCSRGDIGDNEEHTINYSHNIYAWRTNSGTLQYHANGGQALANYVLSSGIVRNKAGSSVVSKTYHYESGEIDLHNVEALLKREGYHIDGERAWLLGSSVGKPFTQNKTANLSLIKELIVKGSTAASLYANWLPNQYSITYNGNGGTGIQAESKCTYDRDLLLPEHMFSRKGYVFKSWNTKSDGSGVEYADKAVIKNLTAKNNDRIVLYAQWEKILVQIAYSGNEQSKGDNMLEPDIWIGTQSYLLRDSAYEKIRKEQLTFTDVDKIYDYEMVYSFRGWSFRRDTVIKNEDFYPAGKNYSLEELYPSAQKANALTIGKPIEDKPYVKLQESKRDTAKDEFINLFAVWDAYPVILMSEMEDEIPVFFEGEVVRKEDLIKHLIVNDKEDGDIKEKIKILEIAYGNGKRKEGYSVAWEEDIPKDYVLDTYFMEMEKDELISHLITYSVTDSSNNTTIKKLPVMVKYNHFPEIAAEEAIYYFKEEVNRNVITKQEILQKVKVSDREDGEEIRQRLELVDFDEREIKLQLDAEFRYQAQLKVTDHYGKSAYKQLEIVVIDEAAMISELPKTYVRFISQAHLNTLEQGSIWREEENQKYLATVLKNNKAVDTWYFTQENVKEAKKWITENGAGSWKAGKDANKDFIEVFAKCKK